MNFDQSDITISHNRRVKYFPRGELLCLERSELTMNKVADSGTYLKYFPEAVYIEDADGSLYGILTNGDVLKSLNFGEPLINRKFFRLDDASKIRADFFQEFFDLHRSVRCIPFVENDRLVGEWRLLIGEEDFESKMCWEPIQSIADKRLSELEGNAVVCDQKSFRARLIESIRDGQDDGNKIIPLYDVYMECLIRFLTGKFREHHIPFFYVEAPSTKKNSALRRLDTRCSPSKSPH